MAAAGLTKQFMDNVRAVDGIDLAIAVRRAIGVALQEAGFDDIQTGRELLTLQGGYVRGRTARAAGTSKGCYADADGTIADTQLLHHRPYRPRQIDAGGPLP